MEYFYKISIDKSENYRIYFFLNYRGLIIEVYQTVKQVTLRMKCVCHYKKLMIPLIFNIR